MQYLIKSFLETEVTCLPKVMQHYLGKHYNNTLYNGITWTVLILHVIRFLFETAVNGLLKKMGFKEYLRLRLRKALWYLGFYTCSYSYCSATLWKNNIPPPDQEKFLILDITEPISGHLILGYVLLCAFFISSSMWEGLLCSFAAFNYLFLTGFVAFTYFFSYIELAVLLADSMCMFHIMTEFTRCLSCTIKANLNLPRQVVNILFVLSIGAFVNSYIIIIPKQFMLPIGRGLLYNSNSVIMIGLNITLWGWFLCEVYVSPLYRVILHSWRHECNTSKIVPQCLGSTIDCALFEPRDDVAYNIKIMRKEIKAEQDRLNALRKPKRSARMLLQTLKCMAAINRRIQRKRNVKEVDEHWNDEEEQEISNKIFDMNSTETEVIANVETAEHDNVEETNNMINASADPDSILTTEANHQEDNE